jgi:hypothetical protein
MYGKEEKKEKKGKKNKAGICKASKMPCWPYRLGGTLKTLYYCLYAL